MSNTKPTMIRIRPNTRETLDRLTAAKGWTITEATDRAVKLLEEQAARPSRRRSQSSAA